MELNTLAEMRQIIDAIEQGKAIQWYDGPYTEWTDTTNKHPNFTDFIYRIKPESKETLLTNRELAKWLAQGNGELRTTDSETSRIKLGYKLDAENQTCKENYRIRKWDDTTWRKPTREYAFGEEV